MFCSSPPPLATSLWECYISCCYILLPVNNTEVRKALNEDHSWRQERADSQQHFQLWLNIQLWRNLDVKVIGPPLHRLQKVHRFGCSQPRIIGWVPVTNGAAAFLTAKFSLSWRWSLYSLCWPKHLHRSSQWQLSTMKNHRTKDVSQKQVKDLWQKGTGVGKGTEHRP